MDSTVQRHRTVSIALGGARPPATESATAVVSPRHLSAPSTTLRSGSRRKTGSSFWRLGAFAALVLALACALDAAITSGLRRIGTSAFGATNQLVNGRINAQIVITGSSRALVHYDPRIIGASTGRNTYNLGRNGSQTDLQLAVLKTYLRHNTKPELVVHNLDLFSCVTSHEIYDPTQYVPYLREDDIYAGVSRVYPDAWKWKYLPLYGYIVPDLRLSWTAGLKRLAGVEPAQDHIAGFVPRAWSWSGDFERFRAAHPQGVRTTVEPQGVRDLVELMRLCQDQGIPLLLVYSPEYGEMQLLETNRSAIMALFARLAEAHGARFWDFSASDLCRHQAYFYNSQHLNAEGARLFSTELALRLATADVLRGGKPVTRVSAAGRDL